MHLTLHRLTLTLFLSITTGICLATTSPILQNISHQGDGLKMHSPTIATSTVDSTLESKDYFWRDLVIGSAAIALGNFIGIWASTSDLESPVRQPKGTAGAIFFVLATAVYIFGCVWLIRAIVRKVKSNKRKRRQKKNG